MADDSFPDLDLDSSQDHEEVHRSAEETERGQHLLGLPPPSDVELSSGENSHSPATDYYSSGESEYNEDNIVQRPGSGESRSSQEPEPVPVDPEPEVMPQLLIESTAGGSRQQNTNSREPERYADVFMQHDLQLFLSSSLLSYPLKLREGFTPEEIDRCLLNSMKISLQIAANILLGESVIRNLPNNTKNEWAHALKNHGWLTMSNGKFFPIIDDSQKAMVAHMIVGAEKCAWREEKKKQESEEYPSAEAEIKAMRTFNMIVELMNTVMDERQQSKLQYSFISTAFEEMVRKEKYSAIYSKYAPKLEFESDERWNSEWFKKYTNRSSLKNFVSMSKFSEIVALRTSEFYFRNRDNVKTFTQADIDAVEERRDGRNNRHQERRTGAPPFAKKKEIVADPNYQSATLRFDDPNDDGSLRPTTSSRLPARRTSSPPPSSFGRQNMGNRPTSPQRRDRSPEGQGNRRRSTSRNRREERPPMDRYQAPDPFSGKRGDGFGGGGGRSGGNGFEDKNRFATSLFPAPGEASSSGSRSRSPSPVQAPSTRNAPRAGSTASRSSPPPAETRRRVSPGPPNPSTSNAPVAVPLHISSSTHDATSIPTALPYQPARHQAEENAKKKREEELRRERNQQRTDPPRESDSRNSGQSDRTTSQATHPRLAQRQPRQNQPPVEYKEPVRGAGFGNGRMRAGENLPPPRQPNQNMNQGYNQNRGNEGYNQPHSSYQQPPPQNQYNQNNGFTGGQVLCDSRTPSPPQYYQQQQQQQHQQQQYWPNEQLPPQSNSSETWRNNPTFQPQNPQHHGQNFQQQPARECYQQNQNFPPNQGNGYPPQGYPQQHPQQQPQQGYPQHGYPQQYPQQHPQQYPSQGYAQPQQHHPREVWNTNPEQNYGGYDNFADAPRMNPVRVPPQTFAPVDGYRHGPPMQPFPQNEQSRPPTQMQYQNAPGGNYNHGQYAGRPNQPQSQMGSYAMQPVLSSSQVLRPSSTTSLVGRFKDAVRNNQGNPNGPVLITEAIKLEITNYLRHQRERGERVFESDLKGIMYLMKKDMPLIPDNFDIIDFITTNMHVTVELYYNQQKQEYELCGLL